MAYLESPPGRTIIWGGEPWLYFSGTGYLGMAGNIEFQNYLTEGIRRFGIHFGGSRLSNLQFAVFERAEVKLAEWTGAPAALTFSSGSLAGQLLIKLLAGRGRLCPAPGTHPALWGAELPAPGNFAEWVEKSLAQVDDQTILLMSSMDPLTGRRYPLDWLSELPGNTAFTLVVDDSHGLGVIGAGGRGVYPELKLAAPATPLVVTSLGKALGIPAGAILGSPEVIQALKESPYFGGASPTPPAFLYAFLQAEQLYARQHTRLMDNIDLFRKGIESLGLFTFGAGYPVFATGRHDLADFLAQKRVMISSFSYPTPADEKVTRVVISAAHTREDITELLGHIRDFVS